jgi:DNA-binding response OmpR family regulator
MKPEDMATSLRQGPEDSIKEAILAFFRSHKDEVFRRRDVVRELNGKTKAKSKRVISTMVHKLAVENHLIDREVIKDQNGRVVGVYGTRDAVDQFRRIWNKR